MNLAMTSGILGFATLATFQANAQQQVVDPVLINLRPDVQVEDRTVTPVYNDRHKLKENIVTITLSETNASNHRVVTVLTGVVPKASNSLKAERLDSIIVTEEFSNAEVPGLDKTVSIKKLNYKFSETKLFTVTAAQPNGAWVGHGRKNKPYTKHETRKQSLSLSPEYKRLFPDPRLNSYVLR